MVRQDEQAGEDALEGWKFIMPSLICQSLCVSEICIICKTQGSVFLVRNRSI